MSKVYIGVGHGGSDPGAVKYIVEKDVNLKMALACRDYLVAHGVTCKVSRESDKTVSITQKTNEANAWKADLALDIHNNAGGGDGFEVFHSIHGGRGAELAKNIEAEVIKIGQNSRGCKTKKGRNGDYFGFIRQTNMPAVICEGVFVDNVADASQADTDAECRAFGVAYAKGILATLGIKDSGATVPTPKPAKPAKPATPTPKPATPTKPTNGSYTVKVTTNALRIRSGAGTNYRQVGLITDKGVYTIVAEASGAGATKWGKLKSGAGWIALDFTKRV